MTINRLDKLDAWRAICCLGVLWIHCWHLNGSIPISFFGLNIAKPLSLLGNGVDFFFVISGFCMYYFYINKLKTISYKVYKNFILSRFYRIMPAYLLSLIIYLLLFFNHQGITKGFELLIANLFLLQNFSTDLEVSSHFWSIAVEWHFYMIFPLILYINFYKSNFIGYFVFLTIAIVLIGIYTLTLNKNNDLQLPVRFVEFSCGIIMAYYYKSKNAIVNRSYLKLIFGFILLLLGRYLNTDSILNFSGSNLYYSVTKIIGYSLLTAGFAIILFLTIDYRSNIFDFLKCKLLIFVGKISYSFYLWHGLVLYFVNKFTLQYFDFHQGHILISFIIQFITSVIITIPIAYTTYYFIENKIKYKWVEIK